MQWRLFGEFARIVGIPQTHVRVEGVGEGDATIRDALDALLDRYPELRAEVLEDGQLANRVHVVHNHVDVYNEPSELDTRVAIGDDLALFSPIDPASG